MRPAGDGYYILTLLKGVCLRYSKLNEEALECFSLILSNKEHLTTDEYVAVSDTVSQLANYVAIAVTHQFTCMIDRFTYRLCECCIIIAARCA